MGEAKRRRQAHPAVTPLERQNVALAHGGQCRVCLWIWFAIFVAVAMIAAWLSPAKAHSFYPLECCSATDCWPAGREADAREPDPVGTPAGWRLFDGTVVPYLAARPSPDGRFHVCRRGGTLAGEMIVPTARPPCLWAPVPGS